MATSNPTKSKVSRKYSRQELIDAMELGAVALKSSELGAKKMGAMSEAGEISHASDILKQEADFQKGWRKRMEENKRKCPYEPDTKCIPGSSCDGCSSNNRK
jgi:hypothetical protein